MKLKETEQERITFNREEFNPELFKNGIVEFKFSHNLEDNKRVYLFKPRIGYKVLNLLAGVIEGYEIRYTHIYNDSTEIGSHHIITKKDPKEIVEKINLGLNMLLEKKISEIAEAN